MEILKMPAVKKPGGAGRSGGRLCRESAIDRELFLCYTSNVKANRNQLSGARPADLQVPVQAAKRNGKFALFAAA